MKFLGFDIPDDALMPPPAPSSPAPPSEPAPTPLPDKIYVMQCATTGVAKGVIHAPSHPRFHGVDTKGVTCIEVDRAPLDHETWKPATKSWVADAALKAELEREAAINAMTPAEVQDAHALEQHALWDTIAELEAKVAKLAPPTTGVI